MISSQAYSSNPLKDGAFDSIMDPFLPKAFRMYIEGEFYAKVGEQAKLHALKSDPSFYKKPVDHIGLYSDHSVVHVRDVALRTIKLINKINGILIPIRNNKDLHFLKSYALQLVYLHDIGMSVFSDFGRAMHPEFAAQFVYTKKFDELLELLWNENAGNIPEFLKKVFPDRSLSTIKRIYREMLSFSVAHSKSKVPIEDINDHKKLRALMLNILRTPLELLYYNQKIAKHEKKKNGEKKIDHHINKVKQFRKKKEQYLEQQEKLSSSFSSYYADENEAFGWLKNSEPAVLALLEIVRDAVRCIRAADALRQRGTVLRTSAGYEIFIDRKTANAVYALRDEVTDELYLLQSQKKINAGEANLANSELDGLGNLRISFHFGAFYKKRIVNKAARNAAIAINDIQADVIQSFIRPNTNESFEALFPLVSADDIKIIIETTNDNPDFTPLVCKMLAEINPEIKSRITETYSFQGYDINEINRYFDGEALTSVLTDPGFKMDLLENIKRRKLCKVDDGHIPGEQDIRLIQLQSGEQLMKAGSPSGFVYYPLSDGLTVIPMGGYENRFAAPWVPLGNSGVIRGAVHNADIIAEKEVGLLCIPKDVYLMYWYKPLTAKELLRDWKNN